MDLAWSSLNFWDLWKAIAVALTGLFGVMGLLTNYKDKDTGRITVWGKVNLAGILLSATMGVLSQLVDAQHKAASAQQSALAARASADVAARTAGQAQTAATQARAAAVNTGRLIRDLLDVSRRTAAIARGTERSVGNSRAAAAAGQQAAARTLVVARGTAEAVDTSKAGLVRIERLLSPFEAPDLILLVQPRTASGTGDACPAKQRKASAWLKIYEGKDREVAFYTGDEEIKYRSAPGIRICAIEIPLKVFRNYGVSSYLDLPAKTIRLDLFDLDANVYTITRLKIQTRDGHEVRIPLDAAVLDTADVEGSLERAWALTYTFPAGRDPRFVAR